MVSREEKFRDVTHSRELRGENPARSLPSTIDVDAKSAQHTASSSGTSSTVGSAHASAGQRPSRRHREAKHAAALRQHSTGLDSTATRAAAARVSSARDSSAGGHVVLAPPTAELYAERSGSSSATSRCRSSSSRSQRGVRGKTAGGGKTSSKVPRARRTLQGSTASGSRSQNLISSGSDAAAAAAAVNVTAMATTTTESSFVDKDNPRRGGDFLRQYRAQQAERERYKAAQLKLQQQRHCQRQQSPSFANTSVADEGLWRYSVCSRSEMSALALPSRRGGSAQASPSFSSCAHSPAASASALTPGFPTHGPGSPDDHALSVSGPLHSAVLFTPTMQHAPVRVSRHTDSRGELVLRLPVPQQQLVAVAPRGSAAAAIHSVELPPYPSLSEVDQRAQEGKLPFPSRLTYRVRLNAANNETAALSSPLFTAVDERRGSRSAADDGSGAGVDISAQEWRQQQALRNLSRRDAKRHNAAQLRDASRQTTNGGILRSHHVPLVPFYTTVDARAEQFGAPTLEEVMGYTHTADAEEHDVDGLRAPQRLHRALTRHRDRPFDRADLGVTQYMFGRRAGAGPKGGGRSVFLHEEDPSRFWLAQFAPQTNLHLDPLYPEELMIDDFTDDYLPAAGLECMDDDRFSGGMRERASPNGTDYAGQDAYAVPDVVRDGCSPVVLRAV